MINYDFDKSFEEQTPEVKSQIWDLLANREQYDLVIENEECLSGILRPLSISFLAEGLLIVEKIQYMHEPNHPGFMATMNRTFHIAEEDNIENIQIIEL